MPNVVRIISPFIVNGNPDTMNVQLTQSPTAPGSFTPYAPGDLGASFDLNDKTYEVVLLDSGATSATGVGAVTAGQVAFWKSKTLRTVTNNFQQCLTPTVPANSVAGIFRSALTPGTYGSLICVLTRGAAITVAAGTTALGSTVMANSSASTANVITATGVFTQIGIARTADSGGFATVDVDIPNLP